VPIDPHERKRDERKREAEAGNRLIAPTQLIRSWRA